MPICKSSSPTASKKTASDISADHVTEAAQVKRTREQAYFNSYDFDAIEVLPYDEQEDCTHNGISRKQQHDQHQQVASSLCSEPDYSSSDSSIRSNIARCLEQRMANNGRKFAYLQRLGALFGRNNNNNNNSNHNNNNGSNCAQSPPTDMAVQGNENFLLPRAMLKYQSVGHTTSTSMPLTAVLPVHNGASSVTNGNSNSNCSGSGNGHLTMMSTLNASQSPNGHDSQTGFQNEIKPVTTVDAVISVVPTSVVGVAATLSGSHPVVSPARNKKRSIASSSSTHTADSGLGAPNEASTSTNAALANAAAAATGTATVTATSSNGGGSRLGSHQSHYSTDKSGSSGYYSSNVCSTYSLDEHIYCEPVIDIILDASEKSKSAANKVRPQLQLPMKATSSVASSATPRATAAAVAAAVATTATATTAALNSQGVDMYGHGHSSCAAADANVEHDDDDDNDNDAHAIGLTPQQLKKQHKKTQQQQLVPHYSDKLRILETSIENLDRHLKSFPCFQAQDCIAAFVPTTTPTAAAPLDICERLRAYNQLPTIVEGFAMPPQQGQQEQGGGLPEDMADDSLLDIDLDAFLLANEQRANRKQMAGIENPSFLTDEQVEENNYKCAKYINSCPEDAYRLESDIVGKELAQLPPAEEPFIKRYEDQLHFQNTRELLEDVRDKIRLLSRSRSELHEDRSTPAYSLASDVPKELDGMIQTLKHELESYLQRMNQHSELEIRQLCSGLGKNQHVLKMQNAFERRRSSFNFGSLQDHFKLNAYEGVHDGVLISTAGRPLSVHEQITTIRCASDPNFKMKRKSLTEVFPAAECYIESEMTTTTLSRGSTLLPTPPPLSLSAPTATSVTQLQRNLTFHKPMLSHSGFGYQGKAAAATATAAVEDGGKQDSISEWHRKKPSIWQMYYGSNRLHQSLLGKQQRSNELVVNSMQPTMSYPSSRPESDFTLDLPRAEQLRMKMEKEKKFRQRCRFITTFLSLVFFLLTVMVVSLVLTRGKRMFGSMI